MIGNIRHFNVALENGSWDALNSGTILEDAISTPALQSSRKQFGPQSNAVDSDSKPVRTRKNTINKSTNHITVTKTPLR